MSGLWFIPESNKNGIEMHFSVIFTFQDETLTQSHPWEENVTGKMDM